MNVFGIHVDPLGVVLGATGFFGFVGALVGWRFLNGEFQRNGFVEQEFQIDMDLFAAEMEMEAAVLEYRLANERRAAIIASAS